MPSDPALRTAIREGIGSRLIELGFRRKSERFYEKDEGDLYFWVRFEQSSWGFYDQAGVVCRGLRSLCEKLDIGLGQYRLFGPPHAHLGMSAIAAWRFRSDANCEAARSARKLLNPLNWGADWKRKWAEADAYTGSAYVDHGNWSFVDDPTACAAVSLAEWRETAEPWIEVVKSPKNFAQFYSETPLTNDTRIAAGLAWACVGDLEQAGIFLNHARRYFVQSVDIAKRLSRERRLFRRRWSEEQASEMAGIYRRMEAKTVQAAELIGLQLD